MSFGGLASKVPREGADWAFRLSACGRRRSWPESPNPKTERLENDSAEWRSAGQKMRRGAGLVLGMERLR